MGALSVYEYGAGRCSLSIGVNIEGNWLPLCYVMTYVTHSGRIVPCLFHSGPPDQNKALHGKANQVDSS